MSRNRKGAAQALTLIDDSQLNPVETEHDEAEDLKRDEHGLRMLAEELGTALVHLERALLAAKGTGFTGRVRETFETADRLQRDAAQEFGRKVGDRLGRSTLWRVQRGVETD